MSWVQQSWELFKGVKDVVEFMVHLTSMFKAWLPNQMRRITGGAGASSEGVSAGTNSEGVNRRPMVFVIPIMREGPRPPRGISVCETIVQYAGVTIGVTALWEWCWENNGFRRTWDFIRRNWITMGLSLLAMFYVNRVRLRRITSTSAVARPSPATISVGAPATNSASAAPSPATKYVAAPTTNSAAPGPFRRPFSLPLLRPTLLLLDPTS